MTAQTPSVTLKRSAMARASGELGRKTETAAPTGFVTASIPSQFDRKHPPAPARLGALRLGCQPSVPPFGGHRHVWNGGTAQGRRVPSFESGSYRQQTCCGPLPVTCPMAAPPLQLCAGVASVGVSDAELLSNTMSWDAQVDESTVKSMLLAAQSL